ncbi:hypothetical protein ACTU44_10455 [Thalassospira sp. SM2505]
MNEELITWEAGLKFFSVYLPSLIERYQNLIAGFCAIGAASIALFGVNTQVKANQERDNKAREEEMRGSVVAVITELHTVSMHLAKHVIAANRSKDWGAFTIDFLPTNYAIYDTNPLIISKLRPNTAVVTVTAYQALKAATTIKTQALKLIKESDFAPADEINRKTKIGVDAHFVGAVDLAGKAIRVLCEDLKSDDLHKRWIAELATVTRTNVQIWEDLKDLATRTNAV